MIYLCSVRVQLLQNSLWYVLQFARLMMMMMIFSHFNYQLKKRLRHPRAGKLYLMLCPRKFCMRMMKDANCQRISLLKPLYTHLIGGDVDSIANQAKENPLA